MADGRTRPRKQRDDRGSQRPTADETARVDRRGGRPGRGRAGHTDRREASRLAYNVQGDTSNTAGAITTLTGTVSANPVLRLVNGFTGTLDARADGVQGYAASTNAGVYGKNVITNGVGVWGEAPSGNAVYGHSAAGYGVVGVSGSGYGVEGASSSSSHGVVGSSYSALSAGYSGPRRRRPPTRCRGSRTRRHSTRRSSRGRSASAAAGRM